ncbi:MAG TPA: archaeosortase A [Methanomicrobiales archaeon]|nr:archaeosortase A [Methanomicrobiales archaeon]
MIDIFALILLVSFLVYLIPGPARRFAAIAGWAAIILSLLAEVPEYLSLDNLLYPLLAIASVPFLVMTAEFLLREDPRVMRLTDAAAIAVFLSAPFTLVPGLADILITLLIGQVAWLLHALGYHADFLAWNIIARNGFASEIILACTGITAIAIMLGVAGSGRPTPRQGVLAFLLVVPAIYLLNLLRVSFVFIASSEQWFSFLPDLTSDPAPGYGAVSFFWAHNVIAETLSVLALVGIAFGLFRIIPQLAAFAREVVDLYAGDIRAFIGKTGA